MGSTWYSTAWNALKIFMLWILMITCAIVPVRQIFEVNPGVYESRADVDWSISGDWTAQRWCQPFDPGVRVIDMTPVQVAPVSTPVTLDNPRHRRLRIPSRSLITARVKLKPNYGWTGGDMIFSPGGSIQRRYPELAFASSILSADVNGLSTVQVVNTSDSDVRLSTKFVIGRAEDANIFDVCSFDSPFREDDRIPFQTPSLDSIITDTELSRSPLSNAERRRAKDLLAKYQHLFAINPKSPTPTPHFSHTIDLQPEDTLQDALGVMLQSSVGMAVVVCEETCVMSCC